MKKWIIYISLLLLLAPSTVLADDLEIQSVDICASSSGTLKVFQVIGYILYIIKILVPVIIIVLGTIEFGKASISKDEKSIMVAANNLLNKFIIGVLIFMIPTLLDALLSLVPDTSDATKDYEKCTTCLLSPFNEECDAKDLME